MSLRYLPVHAKNALLALELARKEATYFEYTHRTLFAMPIDAVWVQQLAAQPELAEKVEAFVSRFGGLQDHLAENCETCRYTNICSTQNCFCRRFWKLVVQRKCCSTWSLLLKPEQRALGSAKSARQKADKRESYSHHHSRRSGH